MINPSTDASLLARLQRFVDLHGHTLDDEDVGLLNSVAAALRRSGEALRRLQEENDALKDKTRPSAAE